MTELKSDQIGKPFLLDERHAHWLDNKRTPLYAEWQRNNFFRIIQMVVGLLLGLFLFFTDLQTQFVAQQLAQSGVTIKATLRGEIGQNSNGTFYSIRYSFRPNPDSDQVYSHDISVSIDEYAAITLPDTVLVRYLPDNPTVSELVDYPRRSRLPWYITIPLPILSLLGLWIVFRQQQRQHRLMNEGKVILGELLDWKRHRGISHPNSVTAYYRFNTSLSFNSVEGKTKSSEEATWNATPPPPGTPVAVLYVDDKLHRLL